MAASDDFRQGSQNLTGSAAVASFTLPASPSISVVGGITPAVRWVLDECILRVMAATPASQLYDGNLNIYDGPTNAAPLIGSAVWGFTIPAAAAFTSDLISLTGPIRGTPGNAMLILMTFANGILADIFTNLQLGFHVE